MDDFRPWLESRSLGERKGLECVDRFDLGDGVARGQAKGEESGHGREGEFGKSATTTTTTTTTATQPKKRGRPRKAQPEGDGVASKAQGAGGAN